MSVNNKWFKAKLAEREIIRRKEAQQDSFVILRLLALRFSLYDAFTTTQPIRPDAGISRRKE